MSNEEEQAYKEFSDAIQERSSEKETPPLSEERRAEVVKKVREIWPAIEQYLSELVNGRPLGNDKNHVISLCEESALDKTSEEYKGSYVYDHGCRIMGGPTIHFTLRIIP